jgi:hypothetical protein
MPFPGRFSQKGIENSKLKEERFPARQNIAESRVIACVGVFATGARKIKDEPDPVFYKLSETRIPFKRDRQRL